MELTLLFMTVSKVTLQLFSAPITGDSFVLASKISSFSAALVAVVGLIVVGLSIRWLIRAESKGGKAGAVLAALLGLGILGGGVWYGMVGVGYSAEDKVYERKADDEVKELLSRFEKLLKKCRADIFPAMPYKPSEEAKKDNYEKAIKVLSSELLLCYTGTEEMGNEKAAELEQIRWLVEKDGCEEFKKRLVKERMFCPQMIDELVDKAGFKDPLDDLMDDDSGSGEDTANTKDSDEAEESDKAEEPEKDKESEKAEDPENPDELEKTDESEKAEDLENPDESDKTDESEKAEDPENPDESDKTDESEKIDESDKTDESEDSE